MSAIFNAHDIKPEDQVFAQTSADMRQLISPLEKIGIMHFGYQVMHGNHTFEVLTTHPNFSQLFIDEKFYKFALAGEPTEYVDGFIFGNDLGQPKIMQALSEASGICNGIAIVRTNESFVEVFYFGSDRDRSQSFYINNLALLENFIAYFKTEAKAILVRSSQQRIYYPGSRDKTVLTSSDWQKHNLPLCDVGINFSTAKNSGIPRLTETESRVAELLKKGLSTKEIARNFFRSPRTIEKHIDSLKNKIGCRTKYQLLSFLMSFS